MPTLNLLVDASARDAHIDQDGTGFTATGVQVQISANTTAATRTTGGIIVTGVDAIPAGSTIDTCQPKFYTRFVGTVNCTIYGIAENNTANFSDTEGNTPDDKPRTTANISWDTTETLNEYTTKMPDCATIGQECFDAGYWAAGKAGFVFVGDNAASKTYLGEAWDGTLSEPGVDIDYTEPAEEVDPTPGGANSARRGAFSFRRRYTRP